ncbi:MFS transporter [Mediterraneibacter glycyrrhizinilyticus]|uniref:MFS transporter n=1 Tax=Mediterraneibacter glycyrrhizinilyticus TaxID=342942 RepID=UPI0019621D30|nr:MFS transporter [Mediterraneibacter glycyrrhizinilyticus]MBM6751872.1 MFS transporter [Mediterraneibacter glycyrrhizinilyticus]
MRQKMYPKDIMLVLTATFFYMSSPMLVTPLITGFAENIGATAAVMGFVGGLMNLVSLFCRPLAGNLADRLSKYKVSFIGGVFMTAACVGYVFAPNEAVLVISRIINGFGFACCSVCMSTWMSNMLPKEKVGSGMGVYGTMNALGMALAPAIGVSVYQRFGYRTAFVIALVFSAAIMIVIQFIGDKGEPEETLTEEKKHFELIDVRVIPISFIIMLFAIPYCATQSFLVTYTEVRKLTVTVSMFFPFYAVVLIILRLTLRNLFDKLPFGVFLGASCVCELIAILLLAVMRNNVMMFLAAAFLAGGYGIMSSVCQSTAILLAGKEKRGLANSTYYIGLDLGMTLGPMIGGALYGGLDIRLFYPVLMVTMPLAAAVRLVTMRMRNGQNDTE